MAYGIWLVGLILLKVPWCVWPAGLFNPFIPCLCPVLLLKSVEHGTTIIIWHKVANFLIDWAFVHFSDQWFGTRVATKATGTFNIPRRGFARSWHRAIGTTVVSKSWRNDATGRAWMAVMLWLASRVTWSSASNTSGFWRSALPVVVRRCALWLYFILVQLYIYNLVLYIYTVYSLFMLFNMIAWLINCATIW